MAARDVTPSKRRAVGNRLTALILWGFSCYATYQFLSSIASKSQLVIGIAVVVQAALTFAESPLWHGEITPLSLGAVSLDTFTNIGGLFTFIGNLEKSESWKAFATTFGASGDISGYAQLFLAIVFGTMLAAAPETLWKQT